MGGAGTSANASLVRAAAFWSEPLPAPLLAGDRTSFVGRTAERRLFAEAWQRATAGEGGVILVSGEPGIGKTRLAAMQARDAHASGGAVLFGHADEYITVPYRPVATALRPIVDRLPVRALRAHVAGHGDLLSRIVPQLSRRLTVPNVPAGDDERAAVFDAALDLVARASQLAPVLLILDDLHWADVPTALFVRHVAQTIRALRLVVIATYRDTDLAADHVLTSVLADLRQVGGVQRVGLSGLERDDVAELVESSTAWPAGADVGPLATALHADTRGNPFFVNEVLSHLVESGGLDNADATRVTMDLGPLAAPGLHEVLALRLASLGEVAETALRAASVVGDPFDASTLAAVMMTDADELIETLDQARRSGLIEEVRGAVGGYRFTHALVRQTVYSGLGSLARARLHLRILDVLDAGGRAAAVELAHHACAASSVVDAPRAVALAERAAESATSNCAWDEAVSWYRQALAMCDTQDGRGWLSLRLGEALSSAGRETESLAPFSDAADVARRTADRDLLVAVAIAYASNGGMWIDRTGIGFALVDEALRALPEEPSPQRARLLLRRAVWLQYTDPDGCLRLSEQIVAMVRDLHDDELLLGALIMYAHAVQGRPDPAQLEPVADEMMALIPGKTSWEDVAPPFYIRLTVLLRRGDLASAPAVVAHMEQVASRLRSRYLEFRAHTFAASVALLRGRVDVARDRLAAANAIVGPAPMWWMFSSAVELQLEQLTGSVMDAHRLRVRGAAQAPDLLIGLPLDVLAAVTTDDRAGAARLGQSWIDERLDQTSSQFHPLSLMLLASVADVFDTDVAARLHRRLVAYSGEWLAMTPEMCFGSADIHIARAARAAGWIDEAVQRYSSAVTEHQAAGEVLWRAHAHIELAETLLARRDASDVAGATEHAKAAARIAEACDVAEIRRRSATVLDTLRQKSGPTTPLTTREGQILELAAAGSTNHAIAATLHLSVKTIERHLTNCYAKLGVRNRTEASARLTRDMRDA